MRLAALLLALPLAGCLGGGAPLLPALDQPLAPPSLAWYEVPFDATKGYHTLEELMAKQDALAAAYPHLARLETIGESREGRPLRALVLENRSLPGPKLAPLFDGGHHPNEVEGVESPLYLAEFLLSNYARNATVRAWVDAHETWIVTPVNPDGYVVQTRPNAVGVNLNRNYDIAWCHPAAYNTCPPEPLGSALVGAAGPVEYAGTGPFSEPESQAVRDLVLRLGDRLPFYVTHHTDLHCVFAPWVAPEAGAPFPIPASDQAVFDQVYAWVREHTEFGAGDAAWGTGGCVGYNHGGGSMDWVYAQARVPSFTMETGGNPSREGMGNFLGNEPWDRDLPFWVQATLPYNLFMLHNAARLRVWSTELEEPPLP
jgi:hypothetical protein